MPKGIAGLCTCCSFHLEHSSHYSSLPCRPYLNATFPGSLSWTFDSKQQPFPDTPSLCPAFLPGPCFLGHLTLDLLSATLESVSPMSPQHLEQCLAHSRCSVRTCGTNPSSSTSNVQDWVSQSLLNASVSSPTEQKNSFPSTHPAVL